MTNAKFSLNVSYSQICVFWDTLESPFNHWEQTHLDQGFAWRPGSACFRTIEETGPHEILVIRSDHGVAIDTNAVRVIEVPFDVTSAGLEVASVADAVKFGLGQGTYSLRFELLPKDAAGVALVRLVFVVNASPEFRVLLADPELRVPSTLLKVAAPG